MKRRFSQAWRKELAMWPLDRLFGRRRSEPSSQAEPVPQQDPMAAALAAAQAGDYNTAIALWQPLAEAGTPRAQNNLGACHAEGLGVSKNREQAAFWLRQAAEAGDPVGQRNFAALQMSEPVPDYATAATFYRRAAEQGDAPAQDMLSWMLLEGEIIPTDPVEARQFAEMAAQAGVASAMTRLGMLYHNALGVARDPAQAVSWWRKGAASGDADAQAMLGAACHMGAGTERDGIAALAWLIRAVAGGSTLAGPFVGPVRESLSPEEIDQAERRAAEPLGTAAA
jgi:uncharacterized protein